MRGTYHGTMRFDVNGNTATIHDSCFVAPNATIIGDVRLSEDCSVWPGAVIRADSDTISIGKQSNVQDNAVLHTAEGYPTNIGERVTIGHSAIVHACDVGNETLIGMGAKVLTDAVIGSRCIIAAGAVIPEGVEIPDGSLVMGVPGDVVREMTKSDVERVQNNAQVYVEKKENYRESFKPRE